MGEKEKSPSAIASRPHLILRSRQQLATAKTQFTLKKGEMRWGWRRQTVHRLPAKSTGPPSAALRICGSSTRTPYNLRFFFFLFIWPAAHSHLIDFPWKCHETKVIHCPMQDSRCLASAEPWHEKWKGPHWLPTYMRHRQWDICANKGSNSEFHLICFNLATPWTSVGRSGLVFNFKWSRGCPLFCLRPRGKKKKNHLCYTCSYFCSISARCSGFIAK